MSLVALGDPRLTLSETSHEAQRRHLTAAPRRDLTSAPGISTRWGGWPGGVVFSKLIASSAAWHPNTSPGTPAPLPAPTPLHLQRKPQALQKKSGCFKHTASTGNATACIKSANLGLFLPTACFSVLPKETSSPLGLKGYKSTRGCSLTWAEWLTHPAQRDLFLHSTIGATLRWPGNQTRDVNTQQQAPLLQPPQFNNFKARNKYCFKMIWTKKLQSQHYFSTYVSSPQLK